MSKNHSITPAERAVYQLIEDRGGMDRTHTALYRHQIAALRKAGLVIDHPDGILRIVPDRGSVPPPGEPARVARSTMRPPAHPAPQAAPAPPAEPREPPMGTLVVRVPPAWLDALRAEAGASETVSDVVRALLGKHLAGASGSRRAVR